MKNISILFLIFTLSLMSCFSKTETVIQVVSIEEKEILFNLEDVQLVDVRTVAEYNRGHIVNSQNIDFHSATFEIDIAKLDKNKPVVLYCQKGSRSAKCADKMEKAGFKLIYDLDGGFSEWQHENLDLRLKS